MDRRRGLTRKEKNAHKQNGHERFQVLRPDEREWSEIKSRPRGYERSGVDPTRGRETHRSRSDCGGGVLAVSPRTQETLAVPNAGMLAAT